MSKIKVLVVDDSSLVREMFTQMLSEDPQIEVVGNATDAIDARQKIKALNPDVVTLDIEMPGMNGLEFLEKIMTLRPMPVIMCSTLTQKGTDETIKALELGAVDFIGKPFGKEDASTLPLLKSQLLSKIKIASQSKVKFNPNYNINKKVETEQHQFRDGLLIAIGSSTGGVEMIKQLLLTLPSNMPPIVITQHMPKGFTKSFANRMQQTLQIPFKEAEHGEELRPGSVYLAPGDIHMEIAKNMKGNFKIVLKESEMVSGHRPSVDVLFKSVAECAGANAVGVILTGMGKDGAEGMLEMKKAGAYNIGQSEESCIVYGMPKVAKSLGAVNIELPIEKIGSRIIKQCLKN